MRDKQVAIRVPVDWWPALRNQAEAEIKDPVRRPGPAGKTAELIRQWIAESAAKRGLILGGGSETQTTGQP